MRHAQRRRPRGDAFVAARRLGALADGARLAGFVAGRVAAARPRLFVFTVRALAGFAVLALPVFVAGLVAATGATAGATDFDAPSPFFVPARATRFLAARRLAMALPSSAGDRTVVTPAASSAANLSAAVPLPPMMMAPA